MNTTFYCTGDYIPPVLQATSESRSEALKHYKTRAVDSGRFVPAHQSYFNFDSDILYLNVDSNWNLAFETEETDPDNWAEIITKHRTIRQFRRIAINTYNDGQAVYDHWANTAKFIMKPRSRIEEIFCVVNGVLKLETDQEFSPVADDAVILHKSPREGSQREIIVADKVKYIRKIIAEAVKEEGDGDIEEDAPSDDELSKERPGKRCLPLPKKSLPTIRFASLRERQSVRPPRIHLAFRSEDILGLC